MAKDERIERLRAVPLFAACDDRQLAFIASRVEDVDVPAGKTLCRESERGGDLFIVLSGEADVLRDGAKVSRAGAGDFFGEIALIDGGPRTATVVSATAMRCLVLGPAQFRDVLHQDSDIARQLLYAVTKRLRSIAPHAD